MQNQVQVEKQMAVLNMQRFHRCDLKMFSGFRGLPVGFLFAIGIQFYLLLSPYICYISLLYLDLYVLGDDALIS